MKNIKQAFEEYYAGIKAPEDTDLKVLLRIEREGKRKMFRFIVFESFIILLLSSFLLYHIIRPAEYGTLSMDGLRIKLVKDGSIREISEELRKKNLTIEGPLEKDIFFIRGDEKDVKRFLDESENFKRLD
ncbi:MAG: hypothetical protein NZ526_02990 [Aquificaceae bacterium]|nr:hypothetical protein [Aquificaceae bacterium]